MVSSLLSTVKRPTVGNGRLFNGKDHINAGQFPPYIHYNILLPGRLYILNKFQRAGTRSDENQLGVFFPQGFKGIVHFFGK